MNLQAAQSTTASLDEQGNAQIPGTVRGAIKTVGLQVLAPPSALGSRSALEFGRQVLALGHHLSFLFFNGAGAMNAARPAPAEPIAVTPPEPVQGVIPIHEQWVALAHVASIPLNVCSGSASHFQVSECVTPPWQIASLSDLLDAYQTLDHVITFKAAQ